MQNLTELSQQELRTYVASLGEPAYRADQLWQWIWQKRCRDFTEMTNLSKTLRERLQAEAEVIWPEVADLQVSRDGTVKFLLRLAGEALVETVLIPERSHVTLCLSTQVGCAMGCTFCNTGTQGLTRNMSSGEILGQILVARQYMHDQGRDPVELKNLVFMGMGEPLLNLDELMKALETLGNENAFGFAQRRMTVSTVGVTKGIEVLGQSGLAMLAVSLHAPTQELREQIMPKAAGAAPLDELMAAVDRFPLRSRQRVTYEYLMLRGVNDQPEHAKALIRLLGQRKAKVNLIAFNSSPSVPYEGTERTDILRFQTMLHVKGVTCTLRESKGQDIAAACGQLKAQNKS